VARRRGPLVQLAGLAVLVIGLVGLGRSLTPLPTPVDHGELTTGGLVPVGPAPGLRRDRRAGYRTAVRSASPAVALAAAALVGWLMLKARWEEGHSAAATRLRHLCARTPGFVPLWPFGADGAASGRSAPCAEHLPEIRAGEHPAEQTTSSSTTSAGSP